MLFIGGDDFAGWNEVGIDKDMEVACAVIQFAGRFDHQSGCGHDHLDRGGDGCAVEGIEEGDRLGGCVLLDKNDDRVAVLVALKRGVGAVCELEMEGMLTGRQLKYGFQGAVAIVEMLVICWNDFPGGNELGIDEDVHVP